MLINFQVLEPIVDRISAPLEECRSLTTIDWTPRRKKAFEEVKRIFINDLSLRYIDWNKKIYLTTDASLTGIGAWIGQKDDNGQLLPVLCASKKLTSNTATMVGDKTRAVCSHVGNEQISILFAWTSLHGICRS